MSYKEHAFLEIALWFAIVISISVLVVHYQGKVPPNWRFVMFIMMVISWIFATVAFRYLWKLVPVKCPSGNCDGRAYRKVARPEPSKPIDEPPEKTVIYECNKCGYIQRTIVREK